MVEYWIGDCIRPKKLESIAAGLNVSIDHLWELINAKVDPLQERIRAEFEKTPEYETSIKHAKILESYRSKKQAFSKGWGVDADTYDYCYNVFGEVVNQPYIDEITAAALEADRQREHTYRSYYDTGSSNYTEGGNDWSKLFGSASITAYTAEEKGLLKKFYKSLSKIYHPDKNLDADTHAEMVLLNKLKREWGV